MENMASATVIVEEEVWFVVKPSVEMKYISFEESVYADVAIPPRGEQAVDQLCNLIDFKYS